MSIKHALPLLATGLLFVSGCAEGVLWKTGRLSPWAREKWAEEEKIADTLFAKKRRMEESVREAKMAPLETRQKVAEELGESVYRDSVLLMRLHAVRLLGELDCPAANDVLENASQDNNADIRIAAIDAWKRKSPDVALPQLQQMIGSDTNVDVRLAATRALGNFRGDQAIPALRMALKDPDPALQLRAAESLRATTGQPFGNDIVAWQKFIDERYPVNGVNASDRVATKPDNSSFKR